MHYCCEYAIDPLTQWSEVESTMFIIKYNVLNIFDMYKKETGIFMYKYRNNMLPQSFDGIFTNHQSNHNYDTRNKGDYQLSMQRVNTIVNTGPKLWNELPKYVKSSKTLGLFKKNISRVFLSAN